MFRNVGYNFAVRVWFFVLTLATTPYLLRGLGSQLFGLYTLVGTLAGYFAVLDLGLGVATIKHVAEYRGRKDDGAASKMIGTAMSAHLVLGAAGAIVLGLSASFFVGRVLDIPADLRHTAWTALEMTAIGLLITLPLSILNAIPIALQRMDITNRRNAVFGSVSVLGSVLLVLAGQGIVAVLAYSVIVNVVAAVSFSVTIRRLLPDISLRPRFDWASFRQLGRFGALKFANQLATYTVYHLDKVLLAALAPLSTVGHYVIALTLAQRLSALVGNVSGAFLPAASEAHGEADREGFKDLYLRGTKLVALLVFPIGMLLVVFAHPVLLHWIGRDVARETSGVLQVLAVAYVVNAFSTMPAVACDSLSRPGVTTVFSIASAALNVALALVFIPRFGGLGAGLAVLGNSLLLVPVFLAYVHRRVLGLGLTELVRRSLIRPAAATVLLIPGALTLRGWATSLPTLAVTLGAAVLLYGAIAVAVGAWDGTDRALVGLQLGRKRVRERRAVG